MTKEQEKQIEKLHELLKNAEERHKQIEKKKEFYKNQCQDLIENNEQKDAEILNLFTRNQGRDFELLIHKNQVRDLERNLENINVQYAELEVDYWALQTNHDNLQHNLNLSQQEVRELEEISRRFLNSYQTKEKKLDRYKNKLDWERNRIIKLEEDLDTNQEILDQKNYRITRLVEKSKQQLVKEREIARNFFANQRNQFISACELDRINFLTALRNKQNQIRDLEEAGGALLNSFYNKEQELQYNQEDLNELQERLQHSEETLESKNQLIIVLASKLNIAEIERERER
jgi:chromosome segregation ATPase